ncbi:Hsp70 protein (fragment) [Frankia canadensis]|uniref:Hsp70 protein n=1 Tax=Frankia canadensis TaxID=1836972 RepID=A0A2I2KV82_9ACTN
MAARSLPAMHIRRWTVVVLVVLYAMAVVAVAAATSRGARSYFSDPPRSTALTTSTAPARPTPAARTRFAKTASGAPSAAAAPPSSSPPSPSIGGTPVPPGATGRAGGEPAAPPPAAPSPRSVPGGAARSSAPRAAPAPVPAPVPKPQAATTVWVNVATQLCFDSNASGNVYTLGCNNGDYQRWEISARASGVQLRDARTGLCAATHANYGSDGVKLRGTVYATACGGQPAQVWIRSDERFGAVFRSTATGECLDSDGSGAVYTQDYNGGNYQHWNNP